MNLASSPATLANWRSSPFSRWTFHHVRELVPSADIPNDGGRIRQLASLQFNLAGLKIEPDAGEPLTLEGFLHETDTDGFIILHRGRILFESYANGMTPRTPHILMSVSKSMLGLLFGLLELDPQAQVSDIVPELEHTAYRGATLRHLLDMRTGLAFDEDYLATSGAIVEYRKSTGWNPLEPGDAPSDLHSFLAGLTRSEGAHGGRFHYTSPNSDLLGWVIERMMGRRYADLMSERLWKIIGAEYPAYITVDRLGAPRTAGGMCVTLRDLARVGLFMSENRHAWIDDIERNGDAQAWAAGDLVPYYPGLPMRYRSFWYVLEGAAPLLFGMGIHGQNLFVDRRNELVIAKLSSQAVPLDAARMALTMRAVSEIRKLLS
jgi:CubicO group peptidase (beta-lactamase class C family)